MAIKAYKKEVASIVASIKNKDIHLKKILKEYYENGFNFNSKHYQGKTLLHYAIDYNVANVIPLLIKYGCNPNICDDNYMTPLHLAINKGSDVIVKTLIKNGADVNIVGEFEQTPLHLAVICGNLKLTKLLISSGADVSLVDEKNLSVLDYAKDEKNNVLIEYLRKKCKIQKGE